MDSGSIAAAALYISLFFLPGIGILLPLRNLPSGASYFLVAAFGVSAAYNLLSTLLLLRLGIFRVSLLVVLALLPLLLTATLKPKIVSDSFHNLRIRCSNSLPLLVIALVLGSLLLFTPKWNFLISPNMDAGNYETQSNHFWQSGYLYFPVTSYTERGVPLEWLECGNTWQFREGEEVARPMYLLGYPILLATAKSVFGSPRISWVVNALFALFSAVSMGILALELARNRFFAVVLVSAVLFSPLFYYYSKQIMSEQVALFGFLLLVLTLKKQHGLPSLFIAVVTGAALVLVLLTKLDAFVLPAFLFAGLLLDWMLGLLEGRQQLCRRAILATVSFVTATCALLVVWLCSPRYVQHFSIQWVSERTTVPLLLLYAIGLIILFSILAGMQKVVAGRAGRPRRLGFHLKRVGASQAATMALALLWLAFAAWNLAARPLGATVADNHDALNVLRLFTVTSPLLFASVLLLAPVALFLLQGTTRVPLLVCLVGLAFFIFRSNHSAPELWWMRRYLMFAIPTMILVAAVLAGYLARQVELARHQVIVYLSLLLIASAAAQYPHMRFLLTHRVNPAAPEQIAGLRRIIPEHALVIAAGTNKVVRGTVNTLRSLHKGPVLVNVPLDRIQEAMRCFPDRECKILITDRPVDREHFGISKVAFETEGRFFKEWADSIERIKTGKTSKSQNYWLYEIRGSTSDPSRTEP